THSPPPERVDWCIHRIARGSGALLLLEGHRLLADGGATYVSGRGRTCFGGPLDRRPHPPPRPALQQGGARRPPRRSRSPPSNASPPSRPTPSAPPPPRCIGPGPPPLP